MNRVLVALIPLAVFVGLGGMFLYGLGREDADAIPSALINKPAPEFDLPPLSDAQPGLSKADLTGGGVKVVNIWASWCGPCRVEHPFLMELAEMGVPVYGINYKDDPANAQKFLDALGDPFSRLGVDQKGRAGIDWGVYGVPETFVINAAGEIVYKHIGPIQNDDLEVKVLPAIRGAE